MLFGLGRAVSSDPSPYSHAMMDVDSASGAEPVPGDGAAVPGSGAAAAETVGSVTRRELCELCDHPPGVTPNFMRLVCPGFLHYG